MVTSAALEELVSRGLYRDACSHIDKIGDPSTELRVLRARLEVHVGRPSKARDVAQQLLRQRLDDHERSTCWEIVGRVSLSAG